MDVFIDPTLIVLPVVPGGCNGALSAGQLPCVYRVAGGVFCEGGTLKLRKNGIVVATQNMTGSFPFDFPITSDGSYHVTLDCDDGCPEYIGPVFSFTGCGTSCNSVLSTSVVGCTITASVTNCPSPTYTFIRPDTTVAYTGPNNSFVADQDGTMDNSGYRLSGLWFIV